MKKTNTAVEERGILQYLECWNVCGHSCERSLLWSDVERLTPLCVPEERYVEVTIIYILESGTYKDQKWGGLPHTMLKENAEFSMHKWHQILLLYGLFTALVFCYLTFWHRSFTFNP